MTVFNGLRWPRPARGLRKTPGDHEEGLQGGKEPQRLPKGKHGLKGNPRGEYKQQRFDEPRRDKPRGDPSKSVLEAVTKGP